jgi:hypothetical protein
MPVTALAALKRILHFRRQSASDPCAKQADHSETIDAAEDIGS